MKKFARTIAKPLAAAVIAAFTIAATPAAAAPIVEGMSAEDGRLLLDRIAVKIQEFIPGKLNVEEIDYIAPAPLGRGFYIVSARRGRLVAMTDEQVTNVMWLQGYINVADGTKKDVLAAVRQKVAPVQGTPGRTRFMMHPAEAIPLYSGDRVVHVLCDPNSKECARFTNDVLKRTPNIRAYIHPVMLLAPGNWRDYGVRDLLCWPEASRFAQWDRIVNAASPSKLPELGGQPCTRDQYVDELTSSIRQGGYPPSELPIVTFPNGKTIRGKGMTAQELDRLLSTN
jgi:hypothetical protein